MLLHTCDFLADCLTYVEDQLQSCGIFVEQLTITSSRPCSRCTTRIESILAAARKDPNLDGLLNTIGFESLVSFYLGRPPRMEVGRDHPTTLHSNYAS